jgi:16S rRNA (guanine527-N7)-methyltransferase
MALQQLSFASLLVLHLLHASSCFVIHPNHYRIAKYNHARPLTLSSLVEESSDDPQVTASQSLLDLQSIVTQKLGLSQEQYTKLNKLCQLLLEWNENVNLISRKEASEAVVWEKHILPSLAVCADPHTLALFRESQSAIDVGTGGGFPGLPLAIVFPDVNFVLLDSVGKKLLAVEDMAASLQLTNVETHHGRAEDLQKRQFDIATGRSVSALPSFCAWMHHLLKNDSGKLVYWIGGDVAEHVMNRVSADVRIDSLITELETDKRILTISQLAVATIAKESGIKIKRSSNNSVLSVKRTSQPNRASGSKTKGAWKKKDSSVPKERGYENFKRFNSLDDF